MSTRVEGRISLRLHGFQNADVAARAIADALDAARTVWYEEDIDDGDIEPGALPDRDVEVVGLDLVQVVESDEAIHLDV